MAWRNWSNRFGLPILFVTLCASYSIAQVTAEYVPGEVIVKLRVKQNSMRANAFIGKAVSEKRMALKGSWSGLNMHHFALKSGGDVMQAINDLKNDPDVEFAEPNYILRKQNTGFEGQPMTLAEVQAAATQNANPRAMAQTGANIHASDAWTTVTPGLTESVVAIIDTGIDLTHSVFVDSNALWTNSGEIASNGIDDDNNGYIDDINGWNFVAGTNSPQDDDGHGSHVAGIVLGTTMNIQASPIGTSKIKIMTLKFLDADGSGTTSDAIRAIYYAVNNGAKVLNNSWGGGGYNSSLLEAIAYTYSEHRVFVAAAGNSSNDNDSSPTYPASYNVPNIISVAATTDWDSIAGFSNYGALSVHVASPGVSILSTVPGNTYSYSSGTSMATPFVSGIAALIVRESPTMTGYQVKQIIFQSSEAISALSGKVSTESRINVLTAVTTAQSTAVSSDQPGYTASSEGRSPASEGSAELAGCGQVVSKFYENSGKGGPGGTSTTGGKPLIMMLVLAVLAVPMLINMYLRRTSDGAQRRRYDRYQIASEVRMKIGDRELVGSVSSISMGGVKVDTEAMLDQGGIVTMTISSPDGSGQIQVQGKVVWSEANKSYGVEFANVAEGLQSTIAQWTKGLSKIS